MPGCDSFNCTNRHGQGFRLFRFPSDPIRRKKWLINTRRKNWTPTCNSRLCEVHFEHSQFENSRLDGLRKLKPNAIPTLFNVPNPPPRIDPKPRRSLYKTKGKTSITLGKKETEKLNHETSLNMSSSNLQQKKYPSPKLRYSYHNDHTYAKAIQEENVFEIVYVVEEDVFHQNQSNLRSPDEAQDETVEGSKMEIESIQQTAAINTKTPENQSLDPYVLQLELENKHLREQLMVLQKKEVAAEITILEQKKQIETLHSLLKMFLNEDQIQMLSKVEIQNVQMK